MTIDVRAASADDFPAIATITNYYIATTSIHFAYEPLAAETLCETWAGDRDRYPWLVACEDAAVVGYAKAGAWRERAAYGWTAELGLYVADLARGRGIGRALYGALLDDLSVRGFRSAIGVITLPNPASVALHRAFAFQSVGIVREAGWKHGAWHDIQLWQKRLSDRDGPPGESAQSAGHHGAR